MPKISVIVPIYKVEKYLDRCVESVLAQTYEDFELILVDDGSPDNCPAMCDAWIDKDSRIKVIHKENGGLSDARNEGFEASQGEWIIFVDADDYVHPKMLQALFDAANEYSVKVSACGFTRTEGEALKDKQDLTASLWYAEDFFLQQYVKATIACCKLYHRSVVLPFPKGKLHEDEFVTYRILFACGQIAVLDAELYGYYQNPDGIMKCAWSPKRLDSVEAINDQMVYFCAQGYDRAYQQTIHRFLKAVSEHIQEIDKLPNPNAYDRERKQLVKIGKRHFRKYRRTGAFDWYADGYILLPLFPRRVKWYGFRQAIHAKQKGR